MKFNPARRNSHAQLLAPILLIAIGCYLEISSLDAQTADSPASAADPDTKDLKPVTSLSSAPDHINFLNQDEAENQTWMFHLQNTYIAQGYPAFNSPYSGPNSLPANSNVRETTSLDFFFGAHIWPGGELYFNPEAYQGYGIGDTHGIAAFPNGEAFKAGNPYGVVIVPRLFYRQTFGFGGEQEQLQSDQLQLAQKVDVSRLTLTIGKMSVGDQFDDNAYAHDQRNQFMNWALVDSAGFDFAQDSDGYTDGIVLNFNQKNWALIWGHFLVTEVVNSHALDYNLTKAWQEVLELDERYSIGEHPGTVRLIGWLMSAHLGSYSETINDPSLDENINLSAKYRYQYGFAVSADQEITKDLGIFTRLSWGQPSTQDYNFTDMSESAAFGAQLTGTEWGRPKDVIGLADTVGGLSKDQQAYYSAGGLGEVIGDGQLSYSPENVTETYYNAELCKHVHLTGDFQAVENPGFNEARGPVFVLSARLHFDF